LWVIPLSIALGTVVPVLFLAMHLAMDYSVRYEKMPFYPYSPWVTRGWLTRIPDKTKEIVLFVACLCLNVALYLRR
jgi:hypothetical protein